VVRNHAGGTYRAFRSVWSMGACSREWTHIGHVGGGVSANLMRGEATERELQRLWEHFEEEAKVMRAANRCFGRGGWSLGKPSGAHPIRREKVEEGAAKARRAATGKSG
jgi:hypothetical protein